MDFFIASHASNIKGPIDYFEDYILSQGHHTVKISHPLDHYSGRKTVITKNGKKQNTFNRLAIGFLNYFYDAYLTMKEIKNRSFDVFVGANNYDAFVGLVGRFISSRRYKVILSADYSGERFNNSVLNFFYETLEHITIRHVDIVISNTHRVENLRIQKGLNPNKSFVVPSVSPIKHPAFHNKKIDPQKFIYVGNVNKEHGLLDLIIAIRPLIGELVVIGAGSQWEELKDLISHMKIPSKLYYAKNHGFVINFLQRYNGIGLAPYNDDREWTYYCSPLKIYEYIVTGTPVLTSTRTEISKEIERKKLGIVYHSVSTKEIRMKIHSFGYGEFHQKAQDFYKQYNIRSLFQPILDAL